jgi:L-threonylcarbamoyladenylate synthase
MRFTPDEAALLQECLAGDGVAVVPTDTVYGLACNPRSVRAIERLYELKRRPPRKPSAVMFFALSAALQALPELGPRTRAALNVLLPGPVTLLLPNPEDRFPLACGTGPLGLRVPLLAGPLAALTGVNVPALQSSANLSGGRDTHRLSDVPLELREGADLVLDGGELPGTASTVVDMTRHEEDGSWRLVREGRLGYPELEQLLD